MPLGSLPEPTRINRACITGPVFHYENLYVAQLKHLGIEVREGDGGVDLVKPKGVTVRRLRSGRFNVRVHRDEAPAKTPMADKGFASFMRLITNDANAIALDVDKDGPEGQAEECGIWSIDVDTRVVEATPETYTILGLNRHGCLKVEDFLVMVPDPDRELLESALEAAMDGAPYEVMFNFRRLDGRIVRIASTATLQLTRDGRPRTLIGVIRKLGMMHAPARARAA